MLVVFARSDEAEADGEPQARQDRQAAISGRLAMCVFAEKAMHQTGFVKSGTKLHVVKVESFIDA